MLLRLLIVVALFAVPAVALADGGTVRLSERHGDYQITVFTSPAPLRVGPVDISVLVQDAGNGEPVGDVQVGVRVAAADKPQEALIQPATAAAATNKLFRSAIFELPSPGRWLAEITVTGRSGSTSARFEFEAGPPLPPWLTFWPWLLWPAIPIALFGIHQYLVGRRGRRKRPAQGIASGKQDA